MPTVLTIAGFDPTSGAGITADLAVFAAHGMFGVSALTALTVQSTGGVRSVHPIDRRILRDTLDELEDDLPADGIKIGMLATAECVEAVSRFIELIQRTRKPIVVVDPVLRSSSGRALLDEAGVDLLRHRLLPLMTWVTPNLEELAVLSGISQSPAKNDILLVAREFRTSNPKLGLIVTNGDMDPPNDLFLPVTGSEHWLHGERVETSASHGTGCAFSSAFLCNLLQGREPHKAAQAAKYFVAQAMRHAIPRGRGHGPMNLLWPLQP